MTILPKKSKSFIKTVGQWAVILTGAIALAAGAIYLYSSYGALIIRSHTKSPASNSQKSAPAISAITALGRLQPQGEVTGEVTHLSAPYSVAGAPRVERLLVKEGDKVQLGQIVALIDGHDNHLAALKQAENQVQISRARLAQVKVGAKAGDINAQKATIARLEAELANAQLELQRYHSLYKQGAISASLWDSKQLTMETTQKQLKQAKATLQSVAEVRPVDVQLAQAELDSAITAVRQAQADLDLTYIRSPLAGRVLKIHTKSGETVGNDGIVELGQTSQMYAVAEIYQTDIGKVHLGQRAFITSAAFTGKIRGVVTWIGWQVERQKVLDINPGADTDSKVVEVKIRLDPVESQRIAGLTNLQVDVTIPI